MAIRPRQMARVALAVGLAVGSVGGCGKRTPSDTAPVLLAEGRLGDQAWRLEGRRVRGVPCASLALVGSAEPATDRCGVRRTVLRHLDPAMVEVGDRLLVFSPVPGRARRVRLDGADGSIWIEPARPAPGFPARFFVAEFDAAQPPIDVRVFAGRGRAVVS